MMRGKRINIRTVESICLASLGTGDGSYIFHYIKDISCTMNSSNEIMADWLASWLDNYLG